MSILSQFVSLTKPHFLRVSKWRPSSACEHHCFWFVSYLIYHAPYKAYIYIDEFSVLNPFSTKQILTKFFDNWKFVAWLQSSLQLRFLPTKKTCILLKISNWNNSPSLQTFRESITVNTVINSPSLVIDKLPLEIVITNDPFLGYNIFLYKNV